MNKKSSTTKGRKSHSSSDNTDKTTSTSKRSNTRNRNNTATRAFQRAEPQEQKTSKLEKLFVTLLQETYWSEKKTIEALTTMQNRATTEDLQDAFEDHLYATHKHASRLEKVFAMLGEEATAKKSLAMEALASEAEQFIAATEDGTMTRDAALVIAAQKMEHYEIAVYGSLVQVALTLGHENAASLLEKTLWEEEQTDALLMRVAECTVNPLADDEPEVFVEVDEYEIEA